MVKIIGITGLVASGKSTLTKYLLKNGYIIFDSDFEVSKLYNDNNFMYGLRKLFPEVFINGLLDKKLLAETIFSSKEKKLVLEALIHPLIEAKLDNFIEHNKMEKFIFIDVPLLFEVNWNTKCDEIILIISDKNISLGRFITRGGQLEMFEKILANQSDIKYKIKNSTYVIENNGSVQDFYNKIDRVLEAIKIEPAI